MPSDIHVYVRFRDQCVFAGEELKCTIIFKNAAYLSEPQTPAISGRRSSRTASLGQFTLADQKKGLVEGQNAKRTRVQKEAVVSSAPGSASHQPSKQGAESAHPNRPGHKHQRSVSIISITSPILSPGLPSAGLVARPPVGHKRSSTVQITGMNCLVQVIVC